MREICAGGARGGDHKEDREGLAHCAPRRLLHLRRYESGWEGEKPQGLKAVPGNDVALSAPPSPPHPRMPRTHQRTDDERCLARDERRDLQGGGGGEVEEAHGLRGAAHSSGDSRGGLRRGGGDCGADKGMTLCTVSLQSSRPTLAWGVSSSVAAGPFRQCKWLSGVCKGGGCQAGPPAGGTAVQVTRLHAE